MKTRGAGRAAKEGAVNLCRHERVSTFADGGVKVRFEQGPLLFSVGNPSNGVLSDLCTYYVEHGHKRSNSKESFDAVRATVYSNLAAPSVSRFSRSAGDRTNVFSYVN